VEDDVSRRTPASVTQTISCPFGDPYLVELGIHVVGSKRVWFPVSIDPDPEDVETEEYLVKRAIAEATR
jgi:hypothetical protein